MDEKKDEKKDQQKVVIFQEGLHVKLDAVGRELNRYAVLQNTFNLNRRPEAATRLQAVIARPLVAFLIDSSLPLVQMIGLFFFLNE